jgi:YidC/Oxa1 family membrane protein insertase
MKKSDITIVALLFLLLIAWGFHQSQNAPRRPAPAPVAGAADGLASSNVPTVIASAPPAAAITPPAAAIVERGDQEPQPVAAAAEEKPAHGQPEQRVILTNGIMSVAVSSWGGGIVEAELSRYRQAVDANSDPVRLDFSDGPALSMAGIPGLSSDADFTVARTDPHQALVSRSTPDGLNFERRVTLTDSYRLEIVDTFVNAGGAPAALPAYAVRLGDMQHIETHTTQKGISYLSMDSQASAGGEGVTHWTKEIPALFGYRASMFSCAKPDLSALPVSARRPVEQPLDWMAVKNKFFVQILAPDGGSAGGELIAVRDPARKGFEVAEVAATMRFTERVLQPGATHSQTFRYYVGPKKYDELKDLGNRQDEVMEFGMLKWFCKQLLLLMNFIHAYVKSYGVAIIILTAIVRLVFWPVTHKSTESMKKMQALQPEMQKLKEKYKDKPQKLNQEMMALYKEHKVNPASGCLPIVIQIPVFIALYTVLRSAIELRFADFLWIGDLSEPERLFASLLPIPLNILPLVMTATMIWQQKLTPSVGDPQQQKMMMLMPVVFLFIFYPMASGLVLYWSVSQIFSIAQLLVQRRKGVKKAGVV